MSRSIDAFGGFWPAMHLPPHSGPWRLPTSSTSLPAAAVSNQLIDGTFSTSFKCSRSISLPPIRRVPSVGPPISPTNMAGRRTTLPTFAAAITFGLPLATRDKALVRAAEDAAVSLVL